MPGASPSFAEILSRRAAAHPDRTAFIHLGDGEEETDRLTYEGLLRSASAVAQRLVEDGCRGERVVLCYPSGLDFVAAFFGCALAGAVAIPIAVPSPRRGASARGILADCRPRAVLTTRSTVPLLGRLGLDRAAMPTDSLGRADGDATSPPDGPAAGPDDLAMIQYTSGSTRSPRGVMLSHGALARNAAMVKECFAHDETSTVVGWLPHFHDMGLIGTILQPIFIGAGAVLLPARAFARDPMCWLRAVSRHRAATSGGPDSAYRACALAPGEAEVERLDLGSWSVAFTGSEPVRPATIDLFCERFARRGFRRESFLPCYGLAEATLLVTGVEAGRGPALRHALGPDSGRLGSPVGRDGQGRAVVSCGRPWGGTSLLVVDPTRREPVPEGHVGEVWVAGPCVSPGYWGRPRSHSPRPRADDGDGRDWLGTGDLGFLADGELHITGRIADTLVAGGRNIHAEDVEAAVEDVLRGRSAGRCAAFGVDREDGERLVVAFEVPRGASSEEVQALLPPIRRALVEELGIAPLAVIPIRRGTMPVTTSGKVRRGRCRALLEAGRLGPVEGLGLPSPGEPQPPSRRDTPRHMRVPEIVAQLRASLAARLGLAAAQIDTRRPLRDLGCDSLTLMELLHEVQALAGPDYRPPPHAQRMSLVGLARRAGSGTGVATRQPPGSSADGDIGRFPLAIGPRTMIFLDRARGGDGAYQFALAAWAEAGASTGWVGRVARSLIGRHEAFRLRLDGGDDGSSARLVHASDVDIPQYAGPDDWRHRISRPLDLEAEGPMRIAIVHRDDGRVGLLFLAHHAVVDFWSVTVLARDLEAADAGGVAPSGPPDLIAVQAGRESAWLRSAACRASERYWGECLRPPLPALRLPGAPGRPAAPGGEGRAIPVSIPPGDFARLGRLAARRRTTPFAVLLAAYAKAVHRWSGQSDLIIGCPSNVRDDRSLSGAIGYLVNALPIRVDARGDETFLGLIGTVGRSVRRARAHQRLPFARMVELFGPSDPTGRPPLFDAVFAWQQPPAVSCPGLARLAIPGAASRADLGRWSLERLGPVCPPAIYMLELALGPDGDGGVSGALVYDPGLLGVTDAEGLAAEIRAAVQEAAARPSAPIRPHSSIPAVATGAVPGMTLHRMFDAFATSQPEAEALCTRGGSVSYAGLARMSDQIADELRCFAIVAGEPVGVAVDDPVRRIAALMGVLKAGAAFVAIPGEHPDARRRQVLGESGARLAIVGGDAAWIVDGPVVSGLFLGPADERPAGLDRFRPLCPDPDGPPTAQDGPEADSLELPAYIAYTSGTTGRPKGIVQTHRTFVPVLLWQAEFCGIGPGRRMAQLAGIGFDVAYCEIFGALIVGATICLPDGQDDLSGARLLDWLSELRVDVVQLIPSVLRQTLESCPPGRLPPGLRHILSVGEALPARLARGLLDQPNPRPKLTNVYGPTETIVATFHPVVDPEDGGDVVPIGRPIPGREVLVLDDLGRPCPPGEAGEIHIRCEYPPPGYHRDPGRTAERFLEDPGRTGAPPLFRTGDLAVRRADGVLVFRGRRDLQLKVRGNRVEVEEVERALAEHPAVRLAAVTPRVMPDGTTGLDAWVEPSAPVADEELRRHLAGRLPGPMIPGSIRFLERLPRLPHGKVDRAALSGAAMPPGPEAPRPGPPEGDETGGAVLDLWRAVLCRADAGWGDHFFASGGHSLQVFGLLSRVRERFSVAIPLRDFLLDPSPAALASLIRAGRVRLEAALDEAERLGTAGETPVPPGRSIPL